MVTGIYVTDVHKMLTLKAERKRLFLDIRA
jgi:hypothetical protein